MRRLFTVIGLIGALGLAAVGALRPAKAQATSYTYFPTSSTTDARFLAIASTNLQTLSGNKITIGFAAGATTANFEIGVFDGNTAANWDLGSTPMTYTLYADPQGNGASLEDAPDPVVGTWSGAVMPDSAWFDIPVVTGPAAQGPTGDYFYYLTVTLPVGTPGSVTNAFKVRTTGTLLLEAQSIGLIAHFRTVSDRLTVYPDWDTTSYFGPTTYNGTWDIFFDVPTDTHFFSIWDGDSDFGSFDGLGVDTNDPDTADLGQADSSGLMTAAGIPVWATNPPAVPEGNAGAAPQDDNGMAPQLRRSPAIQYGIETPDGEMFWNDNPSGNLEWEQFKISREPFDRATMDYHADTLSAGRYRLSIIGFDMGNLNAFRFLHDSMGVNANGDPVKPIRPYWTLGDRVWRDLNNNGQDDGEPGITNVQLGLFDGSGAPVLDIDGQPRTTLTGPGGFYRFNVTSTGIYTVKVVTSTIPDGLNNTSGGNQRTYEVVRSYPQQSFLDYDFGYGEGGEEPPPAPTGRLGDRVWLDANRDGVQDSGEAGIPGVTVTLLNSSNAPVQSLSTDANGLYDFGGLAAGDYTVAIDPDTLPSGLAQTYDLDGDALYTASASLAEAQVRLDVDFGYAPQNTASVGDTVWLDADRNGAQNGGEAGISGVSVELLDADGNTVAAAITDTDGKYLFPSLVSGSYAVKIAGLPSGLLQTYDLDGVSTSNAAAFSLSVGEAKRDVDFGYAPPLSSVGDRVWLDTNRDGVQDGDEVGIAGVTVTLINGAGGATATATTDASGLYLFGELEAGSYSVAVSNVPTGLIQTYDLDGLSSVNAAAFSLTAGENKRDVDFGYAEPPVKGSIGDRVWYDINRNGVQDNGEPGVSGARVDLQSGAVVVATTTTDASGGYLFSDLTLGVYTVKFYSTAGYQGFTGANLGSDDDKDSDADVSTGLTSAITLTSGNKNVISVDAGLTATPTLSLQKTASKSVAAPGEPIVYTYRVTNTGGVPVTDVTVTDDNATPSYTGDDFVVGAVASLAPGASTTLTKSVVPALTMTASNGTVAGFMTAEKLSNGDVKATFVQSLAVVDNTYGTGSSTGYRGGSGKGHTFKDLTNSDHAEFRFTNAAGVVVLDFYVDDLSATSTAPSGHGTLGVLGGDGYMIKGSAANVASCWTSAAANLNQSPAYYGYKTNSPLNDPNWEVRSIYSVVVKAAAFGTSGFGKVTCPDVHNSPAKIDTANLAPKPQDVINTAVATARFGGYVLTTTSATATVRVQ